MKHLQKYLTTMMVVLLVGAAFLVGYTSNDVMNGHAWGSRPVWAAMGAPGSITRTLEDTVSLRPVQLFQQVLTQVQTQYVEPVTKPDELAYGAVRGMLAQLNDPYTRFMDPKEYKEFADDNHGRFAGIGASLNMTEIPAAISKEHEKGTTAPVVCPVCGTTISDVKQYRVTVVEPMPGSPAQKAGLQPGDFILKVDDKVTDGLTVSEVADKIRGAEGSKVALTIARKGIEKPIEVTITRAIIDVPAVESKVLDGNIGYLRIFSFNEKTTLETRAALMDFEKAKVNGVLLDLRNNPGGLMAESIKVASLLLPKENKVIVSTKGRTGDQESYKRIDDQLCKAPIVVLVNKGSASASEILTGALKDYKRATVVGESTFGKALVQTVLQVGDPANPSAMAITTAHYYTPAGSDIAKKGIAPDVAVELDKAVKTMNEKDNQAEAALRVLKEQIAKAKN